ncbi:gephyrin-like molybdotransferase receptor GlpR [Nocardia sp. NPDC059180]|uniref:divisome protein SepX/GlpR n=1 Tax=Nocardia sp. NPDC059180 TaxID=3346761 RepID=UPI003693B8C6
MPNSILWIGLVVLWVFVLFPILADRHPRIRQTTDTALATRVLHRGGSKRRTKSGPAAGHESDPDWRPRRVQRKRPHSDDAEDRMTTSADEPVTEADEEQNTPGDVTETGARATTATATRRAVAETDLDEVDEAEADDIDDDADTDVPGDAEADDASDLDDRDDQAYHDDRDDHDDRDSERDPVAARIPPARAALPAVAEPDHDTDTDTEDTDFIPTRRGRGGFDPEADAIARAARYTFRQRAVLGLLLGAILCGALAVAIAPVFWWGCALAGVVLVTYLAYLRKQVRMEEDIRRRRSARLARTERPEHDHAEQAAPAPRRGMDRDTARALRRRSDLLETDDEDPSFEHLEAFDATAARAVRNRAAGGDMRRAAGQ